MFRSAAEIFLVIWKRSKFWPHDLYALPQTDSITHEANKSNMI